MEKKLENCKWLIGQYKLSAYGHLNWSHWEQNLSFKKSYSHVQCGQNLKRNLHVGKRVTLWVETEIAWAFLSHLNTQTSSCSRQTTHHQCVGWHNISMAPFCCVTEQACYFRLDLNARKYPKWHSGWPWLKLGFMLWFGVVVTHAECNINLEIQPKPTLWLFDTPSIEWKTVWILK